MQHGQRTALVTGASSGMGTVTAKALASQGWHVIAQGRDPERSASAEAAIRGSASPEARIDFIIADLSLMAEAAGLAAKVGELADRLDVMINNAGGVASARNITPEGNEATFAGNHLGHFLLTNRLLPLLRAAAADSPPGSTRVVNVASSAHEFAQDLDWDDLQSAAAFDPNAAYCRAKLANVLFTKELARRLSGTGIVVHAMHPGSVDTAFFSHGDAYMQEFGRTNPLITPEQGADTIIWLATAPEAAAGSGEYWHERRAIPASAFACDEQAAARLWQESEALVAASLSAAG
jgi:NAD(P)-dependent dehydrogenase (short-subunit alcohol dehydrogenase family)